MTAELDKYRVEILKIVGFALMTPIGKAIIDLVAVFKKFNSFGFIIYFIICSGLGTLGVIFILRGYDILSTMENKKWKQ